jgi:cell division protein FtsI (penicillin-binding protein 3)
VLSLGLPGVATQREYRRYYPAGEVTGHLLGFTNIDDVGLEALEASLEHRLQGKSGLKVVQRDNLGHVVRDLELVTAAEPGDDVRLSIDLRLQYIAYRELKAAVKEHRALGGSLVMLDPRTGEVLAMVNQPHYNPNDREQFRAEQYRNRAALDLFEPGSSFKPFPLAAALEAGLVEPDTIIDTSPGKIVIGNRTITEDSKNLGRMSVTDGFAQSSNVAAATVVLKLEREPIWATLSRFGFGRVTGSAFPGESAGKLNDSQYWRDTDHATIAYGYGVNVTPLQLARAYAAIAADGVLRPVSLLALDVPPEGERVISVETARDLRAMLEAVVSSAIGSGKRAAVVNYRVAGKTGTAQKIVAGAYSAEKHRAMFAGFAPASDPRFVIVVVIDEPQGKYYGGEIAAPVFANVARDALRALAIPPDDLVDPSLTVISQAAPRVTP